MPYTFSIRRFRSTYTSPSVQPTGGRRMGGIVAIEEVVAGQVFTGRRTSLRAGSASQVFAGSRTASKDKDAGHRPGGSARVGHAFKIGGRAKARRRVRFPSAYATEKAPRTAAFRRRARGGRAEGPDPGPNDRLHQTSLRCFLLPAPGKSFDRPPEDRTSLRPPSSPRRGESGMVRPAGRPMAKRLITLKDLREEFLAHRGSRTTLG
jgi:hypothetical protein